MIMIVVALDEYSRDPCGFGAVSFNTFNLFRMGEVILLPFCRYVQTWKGYPRLHS